MTLWLRDCSDYDPDPISFAGLAGVTHKATEGTMAHTRAEGTKLAARLTAARSSGISALGAYHVVRTPGNGGAGTLSQQLDYWVARLDDQVPWWRSWPNWVMQIDAEKWSYDPVSNLTVLAFADLLVKSGLPGFKITYASRGQYGDTLTGISTPLWNADYRTGDGSYPGDTAVAADKGVVAYWAPYSGQTPVLLQFAGGPDMNAYRGTVDDYTAMIGGTMTTPVQARQLANADQYWYDVLTEQDPLVGISTAPEGAALSLPNLPLQRAKRVEQKLDALAAKVATLAAPAPVDTHALATDLLAQLQAAGFNSLTTDGVHAAVKAVLDAKFGAAAAA